VCLCKVKFVRVKGFLDLRRGFFPGGRIEAVTWLCSTGVSCDRNCSDVASCIR
jgi:hypothetical protein